MRVLFYNWVDYLDDERRGGGVTVYQRNLMDAVAGRSDMDAIHLSSGISYDIRPGKPRWDHVRHGPVEDRDRRLEIVNSGTLSPSHYSFGSHSQTHHPATVDAFEDVLTNAGPFDVIHFNNLEGLPSEVLELKARHPDVKIVMSWHNYYPVCPQANLWFQERAHCDDFDGGRKCGSCLMGQPHPRLVRLAYAVAIRLKRWGIRPGSRLYDVAYTQGLRLGSRAARLVRGKRAGQPTAAAKDAAQPGAATDHSPTRLNPFAERRARMIELINAHVDVVHCVSERTASIARAYGVQADKIAVRYIGTPHAAKWTTTAPHPPRDPGQPLKLVYLGYMRPDKGFPFLLDALEALPPDTLARLDLLVAARGGVEATHRRLANLGDRLAKLTVQKGYKPDEMDQMLAGRDLGIVPPVWEDNLPQVALEMHCRHLPLLTSDRGGAQELSGAADFRFRAGDTADFAAKLTAILDGVPDMDAYWAGARTPQTVDQHINDILALYR